MESLARSVLRRYFDGIDHRSLDLGLLRGDVVLRDLRLNTAALLDSPAGQALEALPFTIRGMAVGKVRVRWTWRRLLFGRLRTSTNRAIALSGEGGPPNNFANLILGKTDINWTPGERLCAGSKCSAQPIAQLSRA